MVHDPIFPWTIATAQHRRKYRSCANWQERTARSVKKPEIQRMRPEPLFFASFRCSFILYPSPKKHCFCPFDVLTWRYFPSATQQSVQVNLVWQRLLSNLLFLASALTEHRVKDAEGTAANRPRSPWRDVSAVLLPSLLSQTAEEPYLVKCRGLCVDMVSVLERESVKGNGAVYAHAFGGRDKKRSDLDRRHGPPSGEGWGLGQSPRYCITCAPKDKQAQISTTAPVVTL